MTTLGEIMDRKAANATESMRLYADIDAATRTASVQELVAAFTDPLSLMFFESSWTEAQRRLTGIDRSTSAALVKFDEMAARYWA